MRCLLAAKSTPPNSGNVREVRDLGVGVERDAVPPMARAREAEVEAVEINCRGRELRSGGDLAGADSLMYACRRGLETLGGSAFRCLGDLRGVIGLDDRSGVGGTCFGVA